MTEEEWLTSEIPNISAFFHISSPRKWRLFACACCRRIGSTLTERGLAAIDVAERYVDGKTTGEALREIQLPAGATRGYSNISASATAVSSAVAWNDRDCLLASSWAAQATGEPVNEWKTQAALLREIVGNPFRPVAYDPNWRTNAIFTLARQIYDSLDFRAMPLLANALQEAGCDNDDILNHCRDANAAHVRGCWVVDLVLGKE